MKPTPKEAMRGFIAAVLVLAFAGTNAVFLYAFLFLDVPLGTVGTAAVMSLINFAGIAIGYYLGASKPQGAQEPQEPPL